LQFLDVHGQPGPSEEYIASVFTVEKLSNEISRSKFQAGLLNREDESDMLLRNVGFSQN
jgi:hypothetical protein